MSFDTEKFESFLRVAAHALDQAIDAIDEANPADFAPPGPMYLLARLEIAEGIIELELPEFQRAAQATVADMLETPE